MITSLNIMNAGIGKKNKSIKHMNMLQFKWMLQNQIQNKYYKMILKITIHLIIKIYINLYAIQLMFYHN